MKPFNHMIEWWGDELAGLVPPALRRTAGRPDRRARLSTDGRTFTLSIGLDDRPVLEGTMPPTPETAAALSRFTASHPRGRWRYEVELAPELAARGVATLPATPPARIREIAGYQIERLTPFNSDDVHHDCQALPSIPGADFQKVELAVAPKHLLDPVLESLARAGFSTDRVTVAGAMTPLNLLHAQERDRARAPARLNLALGMVATMMIGTLAGLPYYNNHVLIGTLSAEVERLQTLARVEARLADRIRTIRDEADAVAAAKHRQRPVILILDDLTRTLPDGTWLEHLEIDGGTIKLSVHTPDAGMTVRLLEDAPEFRNARLLTAVRRQTGADTENLRLSVDLAAPSTPGQGD